jgi:GDPmannose 4,6-dehydratase
MRALVTGAAGQDGTILSARLCRAGHEVVAVVKPGTEVAEYLRYVPDATVVDCDLADSDALRRLVVEAEPDEIYNLGGISSIMESVNNPELTLQVNVDAVRALVSGAQSVIRTGKGQPRLLEAASGTVFEGADRSPQTEESEFSPQTPYARSKAAAIELLREARQEGLFATSAILYNHESPLRGQNFVTRKITRAVARIAAGLQDTVELGNIEVARDWGWAPDYVTGMTLMLRADEPRDYILATGISHRLSFFIRKAFEAAGIMNWSDHVVADISEGRPVDTNILVGDSRTAYSQLGWRHTVDFDSMARAMVGHDRALLDDPHALWQIP